jgi:hypothetical protein
MNHTSKLIKSLVRTKSINFRLYIQVEVNNLLTQVNRTKLDEQT